MCVCTAGVWGIRRRPNELAVTGAVNNSSDSLSGSFFYNASTLLTFMEEQNLGSVRQTITC